MGKGLYGDTKGKFNVKPTNKQENVDDQEYFENLLRENLFNEINKFVKSIYVVEKIFKREVSAEINISICTGKEGLLFGGIGILIKITGNCEKDYLSNYIFEGNIEISFTGNIEIVQIIKAKGFMGIVNWSSGIVFNKVDFLSSLIFNLVIGLCLVAKEVVFGTIEFKDSIIDSLSDGKDFFNAIISPLTIEKFKDNFLLEFNEITENYRLANGNEDNIKVDLIDLYTHYEIILNGNYTDYKYKYTNGERSSFVTINYKGQEYLYKMNDFIKKTVIIKPSVFDKILIISESNLKAIDGIEVYFSTSKVIGGEIEIDAVMFSGNFKYDKKEADVTLYKLTNENFKGQSFKKYIEAIKFIKKEKHEKKEGYELSLKIKDHFFKLSYEKSFEVENNITNKFELVFPDELESITGIDYKEINERVDEIFSFKNSKMIKGKNKIGDKLNDFFSLKYSENIKTTHIQIQIIQSESKYYYNVFELHEDENNSESVIPLNGWLFLQLSLKSNFKSAFGLSIEASTLLDFLKTLKFK